MTLIECVHRLMALEEEVTFLRYKVEEDDKWKKRMEDWVKSRFDFNLVEETSDEEDDDDDKILTRTEEIKDSPSNLASAVVRPTTRSNTSTSSTTNVSNTSSTSTRRNSTCSNSENKANPVVGNDSETKKEEQEGDDDDDDDIHSMPKLKRSDRASSSSPEREDVQPELREFNLKDIEFEYVQPDIEAADSPLKIDEKPDESKWESSVNGVSEKNDDDEEDETDKYEDADINEIWAGELDDDKAGGDETPQDDDMQNYDEDLDDGWEIDCNEDDEDSKFRVVGYADSAPGNNSESLRTNDELEYYRKPKAKIGSAMSNTAGPSRFALDAEELYSNAFEHPIIRPPSPAQPKPQPTVASALLNMVNPRFVLWKGRAANLSVMPGKAANLAAMPGNTALLRSKPSILSGSKPKISLAHLMKTGPGAQSLQQKRLQMNLMALKKQMLQPQGSNIRPNCPECAKPFNTPAEMLRHRRIHTGEKPYRCYLCEYSTSFNGDLVRHLKSRHPGSDPYVCHICGFTCQELANFSEHRRRSAHGGRNKTMNVTREQLIALHGTTC